MKEDHARPARLRFGEFEFDSGSGELRPATPGGSAEPRRLPPQPARLLALLADHDGRLVTHDEIRERIWSGVHVDFEASLHFCIRQIRTALGDAASEPRYVETVPRRGYRLIPPVERLEQATAATARSSGSRGRLVAAALVLAAATAGALLVVGRGTATRPAAPRIGVMPFEPPAGSAGFGDPSPISERILEDLVGLAGGRARIVGPSTTAAYADSDASLARLAADHDLDYVVNARFIDGSGERRMLAELIRASDGAHVWVRSYTDLGDTETIGREISRAVAGRLGLAE